MRCERIRILNFRNIEEADVRFEKGVNILVGDNAQGKTNLIEAIRFTGCGKSFRAAKETDLIRFGCESASVSLDYSDSVRLQNLSVRIFSDARHRLVEQNGVRVTKLSDMVGSFATVLFCPEHLGMIKDGPAARRAFLDMALCAIRPVYLSSLQKYNRVLKERNRLLREASEGPEGRKNFEETVDCWSSALAHEAAILSRHRAEYVRMLNFSVRMSFGEMMGKEEEPSFAYVGGLPQLCSPGESGDEDDYIKAYEDIAGIEKAYYSLLTSRYDREIAAGTTLWGPHKDDIEILLNDRPARLFASQGQQRSLAIAMKLAEGDILYADRGEYPVYLLDDVLSELDRQRREYFMKEVRDMQVIITCCEPTYTGDGKIIHVENGRYWR